MGGARRAKKASLALAKCKNIFGSNILLQFSLERAALRRRDRALRSGVSGLDGGGQHRDVLYFLTLVVGMDIHEECYCYM